MLRALVSCAPCPGGSALLLPAPPSSLPRLALPRAPPRPPGSLGPNTLPLSHLFLSATPSLSLPPFPLSATFSLSLPHPPSLCHALILRWTERPTCSASSSPSTARAMAPRPSKASSTASPRRCAVASTPPRPLLCARPTTPPPRRASQVEKGVCVVVSSQCLRGAVSLTTYEVGRALLARVRLRHPPLHHPP